MNWFPSFEKQDVLCNKPPPDIEEIFAVYLKSDKKKWYNCIVKYDPKSEKPKEMVMKLKSFLK